MYSSFTIARKYLHYYFTSLNSKGHGTHSPFVFDFITKVLNDKTVYPEYSAVESLRKRLLRDKTVINIEDFGAGSSVSKTNSRTIASVAKHAAKLPKPGQLLFRMVKKYQPKNILELGTSLGITTSYLSLAKPDATVTTIEGANAIAGVATKNFEDLGLKNIHLTEGNFDNSLPSVVSNLSSVDFVFIDGNHRQEPTERYFSEILPFLQNDSIVVFDDIRWSREMEAAWAHIKDHDKVRCTIDLFFLGIVLIKDEFREKQNFSVRF
ncbi:MAG: class I SAM-dependent methyltransferase [Chitinophagaceae bacterium]|nr:class I SAM-dependent methyltransferase [Chitinophagaceae bacterium]